MGSWCLSKGEKVNTPLEEMKALVGCWRPAQPTRPTLEEGGERGSDGAEVPDEVAVEVGKPQNHCNPLMVVGTGHDITTSTFLSSIFPPCGLIL